MIEYSPNTYYSDIYLFVISMLLKGFVFYAVFNDYNHKSVFYCSYASMAISPL